MHRIPKNNIKQILGVNVKLEFPRLIDNGDSVGESDSDNNIIRIASGLKLQVKQETLIHEEIHFISDKLNLDLTESQVQGLTIGILSILRG